MDTPAEITILCRACGHVLAVLIPGTITVNGQALPTEHLAGVTLKCTCRRLRNYYFREENPTKHGLNGKIPHIV